MNRASIILMLLALAGCSEERIDSALPPEATGTVPPPDGSGGGGAAPVGPRVRDVFIRNPFGGPHDNLLADGDFELSIVPDQQAGGQYGWIAIGATGAPVAMLAETGGTCRSGLRCARIKKNVVLFARGTAAPDMSSHRTSIWMKPTTAPTGEEPEPCGDLADVYVLGCDKFDIKKTLKAADKPGDDGWCELSGELTGSATALCMYAEITADEVLVDNATLLAAPDLDALPPPDPSPLPAANRQRMEAIGHYIHSRTRFGKPPAIPD